MEVAAPQPERSRLPFGNKLSGLSSPWSRDTSRPASPIMEQPEDALTPTGGTIGRAKPRQPISRKHVEQAIRLYGETLQEDLSSDYAFDLHFSAIDYTLRALPENSFADAPARKANVRRRLNKLLESMGPSEGQQPSSDARWWQRGGREATEAVSNRNPDGSLELLGTCPACASRVPVNVPAWMAAGQAGKKEPSTFEELAVGAVVGLAVTIKQSPLPMILGLFFSTIMQGMLYLDQRFFIHQRMLLLLGGIIEALVVLDRELGILRRFGELAHKLWEIGISAMLAFARAEGYQPQPQFQQQGMVSYPTSSNALGTSTSSMVASQGPPPSYFNTASRSAVTPSPSESSLHAKRASWHGGSLSVPPSATTSAQGGPKTLRRAASTDGLYGGEPSPSLMRGELPPQPDSDGESSAGSNRKRTESWASSAAGKALSLVPGMR